MTLSRRTRSAGPAAARSGLRGSTATAPKERRAKKSSQAAPDALHVAGEVARELGAHGAEAVVLIGSRARKDAVQESDIDLLALGRGPAYRLEVREPFLVSVSWRTEHQVRQAFADPAETPWVAAWRRAAILHDPQRRAAALQREARAWTWAALGPRADARVAEELTGYAEEVHKLIRALGTGRHRVAATNRDVLALRIPKVLALHRRVLYDSDAQLYEQVMEGMGEPWRRALGTALGINAESLERTCGAALELFALLAAEVKPLLDDRQFAVVAQAAAAAGFPLGRRASTR